MNIVGINFVSFVNASITPFVMRSTKECAKAGRWLNDKIRRTIHLGNQGDDLRR